MDDILFEKLPAKIGFLGVATLNRPKALNALNHSMITALSKHLDQWLSDDSVKAVILESNSEKAFCAGGDIAYVYQSREKGYSAEDFFKDEYELNQKIHEYPKPYISFLNGITMGGGAGISIHGSHRIATENFLFSMPETGIGFFPDVGASYFLSRIHHHVGMYLGLTGKRLKHEAALDLGLINYFIPGDQLASVKQNLFETSLDISNKKMVSDILQSYHVDTDQTHEKKLPIDLIQTHFSLQSVEKIFESLANHTDHFSQETLNVLKQKSPTSLKVTHKALQKGQNQSIGECLAMEYHIATHFLHYDDFFEGIRAVIIDKDKSPRWNPSSLEAVTQEMVEKFFQ